MNTSRLCRRLAAALLLFSNLAARANILTVDNSSPSPGQYATIPAAIAAAMPGDTIYIKGTATSYGDFNVDKNGLTFIGSGFNPQSNGLNPTTVGHVGFGGSGRTGLTFQGLQAESFNWWGYAQYSNCDNIRIEYCRISQLINIHYDCDNWMVRNCIFDCADCCAIEGQNQGGISNIFIFNNLFDKNSGMCSFGHAENSGAMLFVNNVFLKGSSADNGAVGGNFQHITFQNNIFFRSSPQGSATGTFTNCTFSHNITFNCTNNNPPAGTTGAGNIINQNPLFINYPVGGNNNYAYTHDLRLQAASPAHNAGSDGTDMGLFGQNFTFSESGETMPLLFNLTITNPPVPPSSTPSVPAGGTVTGTATARNPDPDQ